MNKKQLGNKRESFSIRKYSIGAASILVGSLLFLGGAKRLLPKVMRLILLKRFQRHKRNQLKNNRVMKPQRNVLNNHKTRR